MKRCTKCGVEKDDARFSKYPAKRGGKLWGQCKDCYNEYLRAKRGYVKPSAEEVARRRLEKARAYYWKNRDRALAYGRAWRLTHPRKKSSDISELNIDQLRCQFAEVEKLEAVSAKEREVRSEARRLGVPETYSDLIEFSLSLRAIRSNVYWLNKTIKEIQK